MLERDKEPGKLLVDEHNIEIYKNISYNQSLKTTHQAFLLFLHCKDI